LCVRSRPSGQRVSRAPTPSTRPPGAKPALTERATTVNPRPDEYPPDISPGAVDAPATWTTWREALGVLVQPRLLRRTGTIALVVGTVLFSINQLDIVLRGDADAVVWIKSAVTYIVPFCVSCAGVLAATHRPSPVPGTPTPNDPTRESEVR
jgi:hypothetical protein